uniref:Prefoldin subunit 4 n=1 Tax=Globodera rostochiensis TaxID=31243 RepID=A0A914HF21_GLORO
MTSDQKLAKNTATAEDQQQINRFARLHKSYMSAKEKLTSLDNEAQNLNDAADELLLMDDEAVAKVPILVGSVFVHFDQKTVDERLDRLKADTQAEMDALRTRIRTMEAELAELRALLYAKFGENIHLETEEEGGETTRNGL